ncbi:hypothetical protein FA15DRAFT_497873 [Coprinopsis marcescibilis]|uniref:DUF202 domain-containing protein n=1 Tax=Coprinopsis marcescibilis TaxID=230819 RepID=A0A5C3KQK2_COPMA|nr:hypothetical protein FA15DRAFT_497873 [Coprinopsis marcescibilis]
MDIRPTLPSDDLQRVLESGTLSPPPTPASGSRSSPEPLHHPHSKSKEPQYVPHSHSLLRRSAVSVDNARGEREGEGEVEYVDDSATEAGLPSPGKTKALHRILRRRSSYRYRRSGRRPSDREEEEREKKEELRTIRSKLRQSKYNPTLVLENSGSVARDHLASERTFLAYVRTSLGLASMGVALVQLFAIADLTRRATGVEPPRQAADLQKFAKPLGALTVIFALVVLLQGLWRYFKIQTSLPTNLFPVARASVAFSTFVFSGIIITIFVAVLSGNK